jgi:hypothetical protein
VNDQRRIADELDKPRRYFAELWFVAQLIHRDPMNGLGVRMNVAILGMDVFVKGIVGRNAVDQFNASDLDDAVSAAGIETRGLGIEHDLAQHVLPSP